MKDASESFFDVASSYPNPLLVSAVAYEPPPPYHFCKRPRNVLLDPLDDLTVEVEKLIELNKCRDLPRLRGRAERCVPVGSRRAALRLRPTAPRSVCPALLSTQFISFRLHTMRPGPSAMRSRITVSYVVLWERLATAGYSRGCHNGQPTLKRIPHGARRRPRLPQPPHSGYRRYQSAATAAIKETYYSIPWRPAGKPNSQDAPASKISKSAKLSQPIKAANSKVPTDPTVTIDEADVIVTPLRKNPNDRHLFSFTKRAAGQKSENAIPKALLSLMAAIQQEALQSNRRPSRISGTYLPYLRHLKSHTIPTP
ncbi:hypothetical protein EVAR_35677_1 [Eumeta japonica]|uniref:Uncharacterized protein n=1 Tax=Eumeta variegata TaxID=151549 RepID=A0A4C1VGZ1_EUMVA|nr:hypothetical protein EVAR_35677_1 [Eumeta japonica]